MKLEINTVHERLTYIMLEQVTFDCTSLKKSYMVHQKRFVEHLKIQCSCATIVEVN